MTVQATPRYQQIKDLIIERISKGDLKPRDRVPSEHELVDATGVSRMTANRALRELNDEGIVERLAGKGTYVAEMKAASHVLEVRNIAEEVKLRGHEYSATVLLLEAQSATEEVAGLLHIAPTSRLNHALIVHFESGTPIQLEKRMATMEFAPEFLDQDFTTTTPSAYLSTIAPLQEAEHVVRAVLPAKHIRRHLGMSANEPCLVVARRTWVNARPVSFARLYHPGNAFELTGHFAPPGTPTSIPHTTDITELRHIEL
jgi:GntR family histidine utilization transcriptional repressor